MIRRRERSSSIDLRSLLDQEEQIVPIPQSARRRMLSRAEAALRTREYQAVRLPAPGSPARVPSAFAAGIVCLASAAGGAAAYGLVLRAHRTVATVAASRPIAPLRYDDVAPANLIIGPVERTTRSEASVRPRAEMGREELRVLEPARVAVARGEFAKAMRPIAEHARRFKEGQLAEEREALRVKALAGLGRTDEARRAAAAFVARFPRSPLLPTVINLRDSMP